MRLATPDEMTNAAVVTMSDQLADAHAALTRERIHSAHLADALHKAAERIKKCSGWERDFIDARDWLALASHKPK